MQRTTTALTALALVLTVGCGSAGANAAPALKPGEVAMAVTEAGFEPDQLSVKRGEPLRLVITRKTDVTCAKEIVVDEYKVRAALPLNVPVRVSFTPTAAGTLRFGCGMDKMISGVITVK
jgi:plastocyanin domain-containing protein